MFYSHQILARKRPLGQIWMAATLHAKINRKKLDKLDIIQICEEILNPSVPMALRLSGILMGGVVIVYERKVKQLLDDAVRLQVEISGAFRTKAVVRDPTLLSKRKNRARKEAVTLPENANDEAEFGDFELPSIPKFPNYQTYISMRLDEVNDYPEPEDIGPDIHQADPADITLFDFHGSFQTNTETYDRFERFDIEGDDDLMNLDPQGAQIPSTLVPSPPRHYDIPEVVHTSPHPRPDPEEQEQVRNVFAEQMEEQNIPIREEQDVPRPTKRKARKTNTLQMDYEQTMISGPEYQSLLQDASDILCKGGKRKVRGTTTTAMKISKLMDMPPIVLCHHQRDKEHVDNFYPPQLYELWCKITQPLQTSASADNQRPDFFEEPSTGFVQEEMQDNYQADHQGSEINAQNLGASAEALRAALSGKGVSVEGLMAEPQARPENSNRQAADISVTPFYSGDDVRSLPSTPTARVAASSNTEINSKRVNRQRPHSSPRRGLEPVEEDRPVEHPVEHRDFDFDFTMAPENGLNADTELQAETGPTQTQKLLSNPAEEKKTESIKNHLKAHFETPGNPQVESLNKLTLGMNKNAAAQLFYQSCVLATRGDIRVKQAQPYGDILIERGPKM